MRNPMFAVLALPLLLFAGCGNTSGANSPLVTVANLIGASGPVPYTLTPTLALIAPDSVCMIDSYEEQVVCGDSTWVRVARIGREGEGPGEWRSIHDLTRLSGNRIGVYDYQLNRFTVLSTSGEIHQMVHYPWRGSSLEIMGVDTVRAVTQVQLTMSIDTVYVFWFDPDGESTRLQAFPVERIEGDHYNIGSWSPDRGFVFTGRPYRLIRFSTEGDSLGTYIPEHYVPEMPNERDVEEYAFALEYMFGAKVPESQLRAFRSEPKYGLIKGAPLKLSQDGLLWVGTSRDHDERSYLDVYDGVDYLGSVQVRDRLLAFDLLNGTLATLVERATEDPKTGVRPYGIDWYDVSEVFQM